MKIHTHVHIQPLFKEDGTLLKKKKHRAWINRIGDFFDEMLLLGSGEIRVYIYMSYVGLCFDLAVKLIKHCH